MTHQRRVLALDVGSRRIGVAISDEGGQFAMPLTTIATRSRQQAVQQIAALVAEREVDEVVVGLPLSLNGERGPQAQLTETFARLLEAAISPPINLFDERLTTVVADQMLRDMGVPADKRKARVDEMAAMIILQDYLDHTRRNSTPPHYD